MTYMMQNVIIFKYILKIWPLKKKWMIYVVLRWTRGFHAVSEIEVHNVKVCTCFWNPSHDIHQIFWNIEHIFL